MKAAIQVFAILLGGVLAAPVPAQESAATAANQFVEVGGNDISTAVENWFALNRQIQNAHLIVYPESGHAPQHQYPELAAAQIALFQQMALPD